MSTSLVSPYALEAYQCPATGQQLRNTEGRIESLDGACSYPVRDGCPTFLARNHQESDSELGTVRRALDRSPLIGWRAAIDEAYVPGTTGHTYITEPGRASYLDLLPLNTDSMVLEIGCSMGQHTQELAPRCGKVFGIDVILEQALFTQVRCSQQGLQNVNVACGGDDGLLPYCSGVFDAVILNLVLEWCGARSSEPHEIVQQRLLGEICRVLRPGGKLFLSTKNRFSLTLLLGGRDEHTDHLRFGSVLPRVLQRWLLRRRGMLRPFGWLHSFGHLRAMVTQAGFSQAISYWAAPEMRYPKQYIPTDTGSVRSAMRSAGTALAHGRKQRALLSVFPRSLIKYVTPGLTIVATR